MLSDRRHTRLIAEFGGLKAVMPQLVAVFLLVTLASIALPGMNGFVGEFLILLGAFTAAAAWPALVTRRFAATGVILSAVYMLWMFQRVNYGPVTNDKNRGLRDLSLREWFVIGAGRAPWPSSWACVPGVFLRPMEPSVRAHGRAGRRQHPARRRRPASRRPERRPLRPAPGRDPLPAAARAAIAGALVLPRG